MEVVVMVVLIFVYFDREMERVVENRLLLHFLVMQLHFLLDCRQ